ncbi:C-type lectin-like [Ptychodera flava]|uniref:C-type lectin-like n=1 Tax=Ptychodera flava TaxID=63121 RepID=UPI003969EC9B
MALTLFFAVLMISVFTAASKEDVGPNNVCPDYWYPDNGNCYRLIACPMTFVKAEAECRLFGPESHIASIHNEQENDFVFTFQGSFVNMWIGLHDNEQEHVFQWTDDSPLGYQNWHAGQPDHSCGLLCEGHCAQFEVKSESFTKWSLDDCNSEKMFVCKQPMP